MEGGSTGTDEMARPEDREGEAEEEEKVEEREKGGEEEEEDEGAEEEPDRGVRGTTEELNC